MSDSIRVPVMRQDLNQEEIGVYKGFIDARKYGVRAEPTTSTMTASTDGMQAFLDDVRDSKYMGLLPEGNISIDDTLVFGAPGCVGLRLMGMGAPKFLPGAEGGWNTGKVATNLIWTGSAGGSMIELDRTRDWHFDGITFAGHPTNATSGRAGKLIHCQWSNSGFDCGGHRFSNCTFGAADVCVQFGTASSDHNAADVDFNDCTFILKGTTGPWTPAYGVKVKHDQGVNYRLHNVYMHGSNFVGWDFEKGGDMQWHGSGGTADGDCIILRSAGGGNNASTIVASGWRYETDNNNPILADLSYTSEAGEINASFTGISDADSALSLPAPATTGAFRVGPGAVVHVRNSLLGQGGDRIAGRVRGTASRDGMIIFERCGFWSHPRTHIISDDAYGLWEVIECENSYFRRGRYNGSNRYGRRPFGWRWHLYDLAGGSTHKDDADALNLAYSGGTITRATATGLGDGITLSGAVKAEASGDDYCSFTPPFSVMFWYRVNGTPATNASIFQLTDTDQLLLPFLSVIGNIGGSGSNYIGLFYGTSSPQTKTYNLGGAGPFFITVVVESTTSAKLYVNGVLIDTCAPAGTTYTSTLTNYRVTFGKHASSAWGNASCDLWHPRFWLKAVSTDEMALAMNSPYHKV